MGCVYIFTNTINKKQYIGKTCRSFSRRFIEHKFDANTIGINRPFHNAIRKYGIENFICDVFNVDNSKIDEWEIRLIKDYNTKIPNGYNITDGGDGYSKGCIPWNKNKKNVYSEESKKKMSESRKGKPPWNKGKKAPQIAEAKKKQIVLLHADGKEEIFNSITDACIKYNLQNSNVSKVIHGIRNNTNGFKVRYV